jgi:hypothetical protein
MKNFTALEQEATAVIPEVAQSSSLGWRHVQGARRELQPVH